MGAGAERLDQFQESWSTLLRDQAACFKEALVKECNKHIKDSGEALCLGSREHRAKIFSCQ